MKFTIDRVRLLKILTTVNVAIGPKSPTPAFLNFKLTMTDEGLTVLGSDSDLTIQSFLPITEGENTIIHDYSTGETLISAKILLEIMRKLEGENVKIEIIDNVIVKISDTKSNFQLNSLKADQYPDIDLSILGEKVILNAEEFKKIVTQTSFAASTKEVRPILTAINAKSDGNSAQFVATDAYRLAKKTCPISSHEFEANIPVKALIEVSKLIEGKEITLNISEKKIVFEFENTKVYSRLLNGDFPKISKMIPSTYPFVLKVNAAKFIDAMQRVSLLSVEKEKIVKMTLDHDNVEILSKNDQVGSANEKIELFEYVGGRFEISFNVDYVSEAIKACLSEDVIISFAGEMNAFSVTPANDNSIIHIITPVRSYY